MSYLLIGCSALLSWVGAASILFFLFAAAGGANTGGALAAFAVAGGVCSFVWRGVKPPAGPEPVFRWHWLVAAAFGLALALAAATAWADMAAAPHGDWDAWSIWNVRARMLAGGAWRNAVSPEFRNHPDYPMLTSSFIASLWALVGSNTTLIPRLTSAMFFGATPLALAAGIGLLRGRAMGWIAGVVLLATAGFVSEAPVQYADIPLSGFMLLAVAWLALDEPVPAGVFASLAAWTKNEGVAFCVVFLAAGFLWRKRLALIAGAAPGLAFVAIFKLLIAAPTSGSVSPDLARLADPSRHLQVASAFAQGIWAMGLDWRHPALVVIALAAVLRFRPHEGAAPAGIATMALAVIDYLVYVTTRDDAAWLLSTSLNRILVQLTPAGLFTAFLLIRPVDEVAPVEAASTPETPAARKQGARGGRKAMQS
ncbi:MAG: hypothetical protein R2729_29700 [Bryobacteraceae bacterium]